MGRDLEGKVFTMEASGERRFGGGNGRCTGSEGNGKEACVVKAGEQAGRRRGGGGELDAEVWSLVS